MRDYYDILGVQRGCDEAALKSAFRKKAMEHHPDRNGGCSDAEQRFKEVNEAYSILSDPQKRAAYDRFGHAGVNGMNGGGGGQQGFHDVHDIFNEVFGDAFGEMFGGGRRRQNNGPARGADLRYDLEISFREAVFGAEREIEVPRWEACPVCNGSGAEPGTKPIRCPQCNGAGEVRRAQQTILGQFVSVTTCPRCNGEREIAPTPCANCGGQRRVRVTRKIVVTIPAGVDDGMRIRLANEGEPGERGGPTGSLFVVLSVKPHEWFQRQENDILLELPVNIVQAALGAEVEVPTLDGKEKVNIKPGTQHGEVIRLRGKGVPILRANGRRGDQLVYVKVVVPERLNDKQKKLLMELGQSLGLESLGKDNRNLFEKFIDSVGNALG